MGRSKKVFVGNHEVHFKLDVYVNLPLCAKAFMKVEITPIYEV